MKILIPALLVLMLCIVAMPAMAIGPEQAAEVGNNPNLSIPTVNPILDTPSGVHNLWTESTGHFNHWINASKGEGKMNNAVTVGPTGTGDITLVYLFAHLGDYENTWIYFRQTIFRAYLIATGVPNYEAEAAKYPDGIYWHFVYVG